MVFFHVISLSLDAYDDMPRGFIPSSAMISSGVAANRTPLCRISSHAPAAASRETPRHKLSMTVVLFRGRRNQNVKSTARMLSDNALTFAATVK